MLAVRKRTTAMKPKEKNRFMQVIKQLIEAPGDPNPFGIMVDYHNMDIVDHRMHSMSGPIGEKRFLPWHRVFLLKLEKMGQTIDPQFFIPYWDWTTEQEVPTWIASYKPTVKVSGPNIVVTRNPKPSNLPISDPDHLPTTPEINALYKKGTFLSFTRALEGGPHNAVHRWCRGSMSDLSTAPADPIFWMHHAQVDRIWSIWQINHKSGPNLSGSDAIMDPWNETVSDVHSISNLGYSYGS